VHVPAANILGQEGKGFGYLMEELAWERLIIAIRSVEGAVTAIDQTVTFTQERTAFKKRIIDFQNSRFKLAECKTKTQIARIFIDHCIELASLGTLNNETSAMAKWWCTELQNRVLDDCVQLHGGYGYMLDYSIARAWADARGQMIYGGTNEIMKEIIGRNL